VIRREQRELNQKKQEEIERQTEDREKKAFVFKLRYVHCTYGISLEEEKGKHW
jgi:hypothetical protein